MSIKIPMSVIIDALEEQLTEERSDKLLDSMKTEIQGHGGFLGRALASPLRGMLDAFVPEMLIAKLREIFPSDHAVEVSVPEADAGAQPGT